MVLGPMTRLNVVVSPDIPGRECAAEDITDILCPIDHAPLVKSDDSYEVRTYYGCVICGCGYGRNTDSEWLKTRAQQYLRELQAKLEAGKTEVSRLEGILAAGKKNSLIQ